MKNGGWKPGEAGAELGIGRWTPLSWKQDNTRKKKKKKQNTRKKKKKRKGKKRRYDDSKVDSLGGYEH